VTCSACQSLVSPDAKFCTVCGTALATQPTTALNPSTAAYAPWPRRVLASLLDGAIVSVPTVIMSILFLASSHPHFGTAPAGASVSCSYGNGLFLCSDGTSLHFNIGQFYLWLAVIYVLWGAYVVTALAKSGSTIGMRALNIRIVTADTFERLSLGRSLARYAAQLGISVVSYLVMGLPGLLDDLWPLWDARRQTLHDKIASTVALDTRTK